MSLLKIKPFEAATSGSGISIGQGETRGRPYFRIGLTRRAQEEFFGRELSPDDDALVLTVTNDRKLLAFMGIKCVGSKVDGAFTLSCSAHGSVSIRVVPWRPVEGKRPSVQMPIVNHKVDGGGISVKLPEWARAVADPKTSGQ